MYLKEPIKHTIVIEKSEFICYLARINDVEGYKELLSRIKKEHYNATHHCSAYISKDTKRSSDDGEPAGTAGVPILSALEKRGMEDTAAIVVRYFGGIKLGTGGLIRAYGSAVTSALDKAKFIELVNISKYELKLPYELSNKIDYFLRTNTEVLDTIYDLDVTYIYITNDKLEDKIMEFTKGLKPTYLGDVEIEKEVKG